MNYVKKPLIVLIVPIVFFIYALYSISDYGLSWDEPYHFRRGQAFLHYLLTGKKTYEGIPKYPPLKGDSDSGNFRDSQKNFADVQENPNLADPKSRRSYYQDDAFNGEYHIDIEGPRGHPALNGVLAALSNYVFYQKLGIVNDLESYQLFTILTVSLATLAIAIFMWKQFGVIESIISSLLFATYPLIISHQHFNIKDPVVTAFYTLFILTAYIGIIRNKLTWLIGASIFFGLGFATKFNIVFALVPLVIWLGYYVNLHRLDPQNSLRSLLKNIFITILIGSVVSLIIFFVSFPGLWSNPATGISEVVNYYLEVGYPNTQSNERLGIFNPYPFLWVLFTTPPITLALFFTSIASIKRLIGKNSIVFLLFLWFFIAVSRNSLFGALNYGGARLIMEYVPAVAMLAGVAAGYLFKKFATPLILAAVLLSLFPISKYHPHENVYFNFLIGGLAGAKEKDFPSWGDSYGNAYYQGLFWLNQHAETNAKVSLPIANTSNIPRFKLRPDIAVSPKYWSGLAHQGEYLIELTYEYQPMNWFALRYLNEAMSPLYEIKVDGVAIAKVWKNDSEYVRPEYLKINRVATRITAMNKVLQIRLPNIQKVMKVEITYPKVGCDSVKTGYVETSVDGKNWSREPEDIARDQLNRSELKELSSLYEFYFMAKPASYLNFHIDSESACILKAKQAIVETLD